MSYLSAFKTNRTQLLPILLGLLLLAFAMALIFACAMMHGYNHDENQFIASGYLLAKQGLLPDLDYPYFHMPNLVLIYALIYMQVTNLLFWARLFSALCGAATLGILCLVTYGFLKQHSPWLRVGMAIGVGLLLLASPLFIDTSGRVWNHDSGVLCLLLASVIFLYGAPRAQPHFWMFFSGLFSGKCCWHPPEFFDRSHRLWAGGFCRSGYPHFGSTAWFAPATVDDGWFPGRHAACYSSVYSFTG
jgi:hypothetical protein